MISYLGRVWEQIETNVVLFSMYARLKALCSDYLPTLV